MREKIFRTRVPLYKTNLRVIVTDDVASCVKKHIADEDRNVLAITAWIRGVLTVIVPEHVSLGIIAHEVVHVATEVLDHHGVKWGPKNDEPHAYIVGAVMDWFASSIAKDAKSPSRTQTNGTQ